MPGSFAWGFLFNGKCFPGSKMLSISLQNEIFGHFPKGCEVSESLLQSYSKLSSGLRRNCFFFKPPLKTTSGRAAVRAKAH